MHNEAKRMAEWAMCKAREKGYDCLSSQDWDDLKDCIESAEKAVKTEYYHHILEEMYEGKEHHKKHKEHYEEHEEESEYEIAKHDYIESKHKHRLGTAEDKQARINDLDCYLKEMHEDIEEIMEGAMLEEKNMIKAKLQTIIQKIS